MTFYHLRQIETEEKITIVINEKTIETKEDETFLGVYIQQYLHFDTESDQVCNKL